MTTIKICLAKSLETKKEEHSEYMKQWRKGISEEKRKQYGEGSKKSMQKFREKQRTESVTVPITRNDDKKEEKR